MHPVTDRHCCRTEFIRIAIIVGYSLTPAGPGFAEAFAAGDSGFDIELLPIETFAQ